MVDLSDSLKNAFKKWDIRIFVLISLLFQVLLILFASGRKRNTLKAFTFFTWSIYLLADWVAGFTLGLLCTTQGNYAYDATPKCNNTMINMTVVNKVPILSTSKHKLDHNYNGDLLAFWAPFLLLHLGGPDTITAFSMEDNSLWPRHLMGLLFQVGTTVYILLMSLPHNNLLAPIILMFLAGTIKYSERTYVLYCASFDNFRDSILTKKTYKHVLLEEESNNRESISKIVQLAHEFFVVFKGIIVDQYSSEAFFGKYLNYFRGKKSSVAFKLIEYELSFLYDVLFTKAAVLHTCVGYILRFLCTSFIMAASVLFFLSNKKHDFTRLDVWITYILLGGAISLDILAYIMLIFSKWTIVRLKELESRFKFRAPLIISRTISKAVSTSREWSGSMMQHSFMKTCLPHNDSSHLRKIVDTIGRSIRVDMKLLDKLESPLSEPITYDLKEFIFQYMLNMSTKIVNSNYINKQMIEELAKMGVSRGSLVLEKYNIMDTHLKKSVEDRFERSILMWHIATDICYYTEEENERKKLMRVSKRLSDYMMYLLFMRPSMIPSVANFHIMCRQTCAQMIRLTQEMRNQQLKDACNHFLSLSKFQIMLHDDEDTTHESVLTDALDLVKKLKEQVMVEGIRWEMVNEVWVDMLIYAAIHCPGIAHAQALSEGGELLTFVSFLAFHLGLGLAIIGSKEYLIGES